MTRDLAFSLAAEADAPELAAMRTRVAARLTEQFGTGHWSSAVTERGVLRGIRGSRVLVARSGEAIVGTLRLQTKKPWAIDPAYFTSVQRCLYLGDMAVEPGLQRSGVGRRLLEEARVAAAAFPAQSIRLDAYDAPAGAGGFYAKCGYREVGRVVYRSVPLVYYELQL
jgi:GNAT superfamily N-acetyltransferase